MGPWVASFAQESPPLAAGPITPSVNLSAPTWLHPPSAPPGSLVPVASPSSTITLPAPKTQEPSTFYHLGHFSLRLHRVSLGPICSLSVPRALLSMASSPSVVLWLSSAKTPSWLLPLSTLSWACVLAVLCCTTWPLFPFSPPWSHPPSSPPPPFTNPSFTSRTCSAILHHDTFSEESILSQLCCLV